MRSAHVIAIIAVIWSAPASANWQFTKWGMKTGEVIKASGNAATALSPAESQGRSLSDRSAIAEIGMPYRSGSFTFDVAFLFGANDGGLRLVDLRLTGGSPYALEGTLKAKYGVPREAHHTEFGDVLWWNAGPDQIMFSRIGSMADVDYSPRLTTDNSGL